MIPWKTAGSQAGSSLPPHWLAIFAQASNLDEVLAEIWRPVLQRARAFVFRLETITTDLSVAVDKNTNDLLGLFYVTQSIDPISGWLAGPPARRAELAAASKLMGVQVPSSIEGFYSIHNGLLENGNGAIGVRPIQKVSRLAERTGGAHIDANEGLDRENLLEFSGDREGNVQCFDLARRIGKGDFLTVEWDHQSNELKRPITFWGYMKDFSIKILG